MHFFVKNLWLVVIYPNKEIPFIQISFLSTLTFILILVILNGFWVLNVEVIIANFVSLCLYTDIMCLYNFLNYSWDSWLAIGVFHWEIVHMTSSPEGKPNMKIMSVFTVYTILYSTEFEHVLKHVFTRHKFNARLCWLRVERVINL